MLTKFRLAAALLAGLAVPALAQMPATPSTRPVMPPSATSTMKPPTSSAPTVGSPVAPASSAAPVKPTTAGPAAAPVMPAASTKRIDINSASETDLASLPGIGPVTAKAIVSGRPWDDLNDLVKKKAMNKSVYDSNKARFALANINTSSAADMAASLPGIGTATAPKIVAGRPYATPADLVSKKILTDAQYSKVKDVITY